MDEGQGGSQLRLATARFSDHPIDGRIAALVANPSYSFNEDHFSEFQALGLLAGQPNVVWDDVNVRPCHVFSGELILTLQPVEVEEDLGSGCMETIARSCFALKSKSMVSASI